MRKTVFTLICFFYLHAIANDGAYYASGNHLIPINETDISVQKEILQITRKSERTITVDVYYEFYNPGAQKTMTVGFEAFSPMGDVDGSPKNGQHPYMSDFTVNINDKHIPHNIAYVEDSVYVKDGKIESQTLAKIKEGIYNENCVEFFYVYYFDATFKPGVNIVKHTYKYKLSGSVDKLYSFDYILTAANRWANNQIDDFTLIIDMGEFETFDIAKTFFTNDYDWDIVGKGKIGHKLLIDDWTDDNSSVEFHIHHGPIIYRKKNFHPENELYLSATNPYFYSSMMDEESLYLPFSYYIDQSIIKPRDEFEHKILRNLPFARRGYVFKDKKVQAFYEENVDWYMPDPDYIPNSETLHEEEKEWLKYCKTISF
ncbi:YARHG domain-containing protein [Bacteroides sp. 519]|uniref:YARHG domain-containing protein n=1 Tax=Bacteroides sp. 519 TaxID=2302937 RepID=UPI0013D13A3C|nr:YARHG domain-containing protein [Bacteroides sp. 519]NDV60643.1 YARHG domain-containing protein [Bacteroides sp. 519]